MHSSIVKVTCNKAFKCCNRSHWPQASSRQILANRAHIQGNFTLSPPCNHSSEKHLAGLTSPTSLGTFSGLPFPLYVGGRKIAVFFFPASYKAKSALFFIISSLDLHCPKIGEFSSSSMKLATAGLYFSFPLCRNFDSI